MSTSFFHDATVVSDLLAVCQGEGWLSPTVRPKVQIMIEHGLHPEQALIGTGLVSPEQYGEALSQLFEVPFVRKTEGAARHVDVLNGATLNKARAFVADRDPSSALVAFADPSHPEALQMIDRALQRMGIALVPAVALWSELQSTNLTPQRAVASLRRQLEHALAQSSATQFEVGSSENDWHTHHEGLHVHDRSWQEHHPAAAGSALVAHLTYHTPTDWQVREVQTSQGSLMQLQRETVHTHEAHPLNWSQAMQIFASTGKGVCVVVRADKSTEKLLHRRWPKAVAGAHWRASLNQPHVYHAQEADEREEALHAALSGRPVLVLQPDEQVGWLQGLRPLGIPVSCLTRTVLPEGAAWTAHTL